MYSPLSPDCSFSAVTLRVDKDSAICSLLAEKHTMLRGTDQVHTNRRLHLGGTGSLEVPGLLPRSFDSQLLELLEIRRNLV
ncbi:unnamed protein product [Ixodes pacificus]